jgi:hypothetical protein
MADAGRDVQRLSPDNLVMMFSRSHIALCLIVAVGLHVVVLATTSTRYIRDTWIDPEGAERRRVGAEQAREAAEAEARARREARRRAATQRAATRPAEGVPRGAERSAVYKATTQTAGPDEIPKDPGNLTVPLE